VSAELIVLLSVLLFLLVAGLFVVFVVALLRVLKDRVKRTRAQLAVDLAGEGLVLGPEGAVYRGGTGGYPGLKGNGTIALTGQRLIFVMLVGKGVELPVEDITGVHESKVFKGGVAGGMTHVVVETTRGEAGFFVQDNVRWIAALRDVAQSPR
jgi:hypothetical protein